MFRGPQTGAAHAAAACHGWIGDVSGSFGVSNKGFQHTSMFKHGIIVIPKMLRMFFNVIVLKGLAFARVWSHAEHTNETPNKEPWHDIWHGLSDVCCFILTL